MSAPPGTSAPAVIPQVTPAPGSRLEQLMNMRETAQAAFDEAKARLDAINAGIEADAAAAFPGQLAVDITGSPHWPALRLRWHLGNWYVPVGTLRDKYPAVYQELATRQKGHWQLHKLGGP